MQSSPSADSPRPSRWRRVFFQDGKLHPLWRVGLYAALVFYGQALPQIPILAVYLVVQSLGGAAFPAVVQELARGAIPPSLLISLSWAGLIWVLGATWAFCRWLDRRPFVTLGLARGNLGRETAGGLALGLASMAIILLAFIAFGWAQIEAAAASPAAGSALALAAMTLLPAAAIEEILFRGYLLQTLEEWRGWRTAVLGSSALFGLAHWQNPNATWLALINIALAGAAFAFAYRLTRRLWLAMAYHFMWNYAQGPLLGFPVSGLDFGAWLQTRVAGPALWTGAAFGPEGGLVATLVLMATLGALRAWGRRGAQDR